jgi:hypothetical protein
MLVVGAFANVSTIGGYVTAAYGWHVVFLILMEWYCGSIGLSFWPYTCTDGYFDFVETKTNYS